MVRKQDRVFQATIHIRRLNHVPGSTGTYYAKAKIKRAADAGTHKTKRMPISNSKVLWQEVWQPKCAISTDAYGELKPCTCRIKIYKESIRETGREEMKIGYVDINLSAFAGENDQSKEYKQILKGKDVKGKRQDNSVLEVEIKMLLLTGDRFFRTPKLESESLIHVGEDSIHDLSNLDSARNWEYDTGMPARDHIRLSRVDAQLVVNEIMIEARLDQVGVAMPDKRSSLHSLSYNGQYHVWHQ
eukprot:comp24264_c6_seq1/m.45189 comp24264_c6_seq1/g.45189  ORF comp24264_c6_seq1/g.45189 comp24264_c6_seq1/m.45189 type:complete len:244 (-) comp24264_c6_seq1:23-754(-)